MEKRKYLKIIRQSLIAFLLFFSSILEACLEPFEEWLLCSCRQGKWVRRYYYSNSERKCRMYWYDGCEGSTKNDFDDLSTCLAKCEGILPSNKLESHSEVILNVLVINLKKLWIKGTNLIVHSHTIFSFSTVKTDKSFQVILQII